MMKQLFINVAVGVILVMLFAGFGLSSTSGQDGITDTERCCWGRVGDLPVAGDFDGTGEFIALFRPSSGHWFYGSHFNAETVTSMETRSWGRPGDLPFAGDFDGNQIAGVGVYRPAERTWYFDEDRDGRTDFTVADWGQAGDLPVAGDFNGDGTDDIALFRPADGTWYYDFDLNGDSDVRMQGISWGRPGDLPFAGDFDGDGVEGVGVYRPSSGQWYFDNDRDGTTDFEQTHTSWGRLGDLPFAIDYGGIGTVAVGVYRDSQGEWYWDGVDPSAIAASNADNLAQPSTPTQYTARLHIDSIRVLNGEEDATRASSGQDEVYIFYYLHELDNNQPIQEAARGWGVFAMQAGDSYQGGVPDGPGQFLRPIELEVSGANTVRATLIVMESENDEATRRAIRALNDTGNDITLTGTTGSDVVDTVIDYLARFFSGLLDGNDLLGVRGLTLNPVSDNAGLIGGEWVVTGSNLGDVYDYRIEYTLEIIGD